MPKLLILDNYDSFTYNLVQLVEQQGQWEFEVHKNDEITIEKVAEFDEILLSPGPGLPAEAGIMPAIFEKYAQEKSILGICLGHHALAEAFGGQLYNFSQAVHGVQREMRIIAPHVLFRHIPSTIEVGLYHSWAVQKENLPTELLVTAMSDKGVIMAMKHRKFNLHSLQFHPESIMTPYGREMINNWLNDRF